MQQYCDLLGITTVTHYDWIKKDSESKYLNAYREGITERRQQLVDQLNEVTREMSEKSTSARLEAIKYLLERQDRMYIANLKSMGINLSEGTDQEKISKIYDCYHQGLINNDTAKMLLSALKTKSDIDNPNAGNQQIILKIDKDDGKL
ncbi:hypothetical protein [Fangia hongkongensis]|uniref:hypothetical protein n=1 Tax=Fangia hongkongensis TaxID=270495 RepID=UPI00035ECD56|nr:hypothetical protein [Fangia hongkongensis]